MPAKTETKTEETKAAKWLVVVNNAPTYCGVGAGGVQFEEHDGYTVTKQQ